MARVSRILLGIGDAFSVVAAKASRNGIDRTIAGFIGLLALCGRVLAGGLDCRVGLSGVPASRMPKCPHENSGKHQRSGLLHCESLPHLHSCLVEDSVPCGILR